MPLKKQNFGEEEIAIFDEAVIYKRGGYWHFRMWLTGEGKYARKSLRTRSQTTAIEKGKDFYLELYSNQKAGKKYFSLTAKEGVARYVANRDKDVEAGLIVKGRLGTIKTHLAHWLDFIGRDTKLKEMERSDCEDYYLQRIKLNTTKNLPANQVTVLNEQSTINAMMAWLFKNNEAHIDHFEFKRLPRLDRKDDSIRRSTFTPNEIDDIGSAISQYWDNKRNKIDDKEWYGRKLACYYFLIASVTGLRTGEQRQLRWGDLQWSDGSKGIEVPLVTISIRAETSKVRQSRKFIIRDNGYFLDLRRLITPLYKTRHLSDLYVFSLDGENPITQRALLYHFGKIIELADIPDRQTRDIVPYSFRHYFITQKLVNGLAHRQVADICGTSITQIEKTYYHVNDDMMVDAALADHDMGNDGIIVRDWSADNLEDDED